MRDNCFRYGETISTVSISLPIVPVAFADAGQCLWQVRFDTFDLFRRRAASGLRFHLEAVPFGRIVARRNHHARCAAHLRNRITQRGSRQWTIRELNWDTLVGDDVCCILSETARSETSVETDGDTTLGLPSRS